MPTPFTSSQWQQRRKQQGKDTSAPNIIMASTSQVAWQKVMGLATNECFRPCLLCGFSPKAVMCAGSHAQRLTRMHAREYFMIHLFT